jgi:hypothetical protein
MIYAATWDLTGEQAYYDRYRNYVEAAVDQSLTLGGGHPTYALLQMQASLELLAELETDLRLREKMKTAMGIVAAQCAERAKSAAARSKDLDLTMRCTDWRTGESLDAKGSYRPVWYAIREGGEAALTQLMVAEEPLAGEQRDLLHDAILRLDPQRVSSCGIFYLQAAYWKDRRFRM